MIFTELTIFMMATVGTQRMNRHIAVKSSSECQPVVAAITWPIKNFDKGTMSNITCLITSLVEFY